jgi:peptidoglycan hydrolase-like protein with peptidoglycan-binding domain
MTVTPGSGSTTGSGSIEFTEELYPGLTDEQVTELQATLTTLGVYSGPITGYYGPLTEAAVEQFQTDHGIEAVGDVGPQTRAELNSLLSGSSTSTSAGTSSASNGHIGDSYVFENFIGYGYTGTDVTELQERLAAFGVYSGPVTGYFGSLTQAAVEKFQTNNGIEAVGYVGPATRAALNQ